ncbi:MAG TPA: SDR family oxidoreductase [Candidatus Acidoferrales bacterium]|nr:SDR family oxidoreductase [Candidatus Acidoferrales bacterium]
MKDKTILVTGSSRGIGRETAYQFAREKAKIIVTYCEDKIEAEKTYEKCLELGATEALIVELNLTDNSCIVNAVDEVIKKFKVVDILVNNAGVISWTPLKAQNLNEIENQTRTNLEGLIKLTKVCLPYVKDQIINIASIAGTIGFVDLTVYCATKFGVRGFTQALAKEEQTVKVYSINPDRTATRMTSFKGRPPEDVAKVVLNTAKGLYGLPSGSDIDVWKVIS